MRFVKNIFFFSLLFLSLCSLAQVNLADKRFAENEYAEAIKLYKRALKKDAKDIHVLEKLATSYRLLKDYKNAEEYYAMLVQLEGRPVAALFYYAEMLKNNGKADLAKEQYQKYAAVAPNDKTIEVKIKSLSELKEIVQQAPLFKIKPVSGINTNEDELAPAYYKNGLVYTSNRINDMVYFETNSTNNKPFYDMYFSQMEKKSDSLSGIKFGKTGNFSSRLNSPFHDGPATFNADQSVVYFERVEVKKSTDKNFTNRAKIFYSVNANGVFGKPMPFIYNSDDYSVGHPCLSSDGEKLYFASDMPGAIGGKDIYVCNKEGDSWSKPVNLGPSFNTTGDELFPYIRKDGVLFYASDGFAGIGALDVYMCDFKKGKFSKPYNLGAPLNSDGDDFGIIFDEECKNGFFSSSREKGKGDDIFYFESNGSFVTFDGKILLSRNENDPLKNSKLFLYKEDGTLLKISSTDTVGMFSFRNLPADQKYIVKVDETDPALAGKYKVYLADEDSRIVKVTVINKKGQIFRFTSLPPDMKKLPFLDEEDVAFAGRFLLNGDSASPIANTKIFLYDENGKFVEAITTNENGGFLFRSLPPDKNYSIRFEEAEDSKMMGKKIVLVNKDGKVILESKVAFKNAYEFRLLPDDVKKMHVEEAVDGVLAGKLMFGANGDRPLKNTKVGLYDEDGKLVGYAMTDAFGKFIFKSLPPDKKYMVRVDFAEDSELAGQKLVLKTWDDKVIKESLVVMKGAYEFKLLPPDINNLPLEEVTDVPLSGNLMFGSRGDKPIAYGKVGLYDENGKLIEVVMTDVNGRFVFRALPPDRKYSIRVIEADDSQLAGSPITIKNSKGDVVKRVNKNANGGYEFKILPEDVKKMHYEEVVDNISVAGNFMYGNDGTSPLSNVKVGIYNDRGELVGTATTNEMGAFVFRELPPGKNYKIRVMDVDDPRLADTKLTMKNKNGDVMGAGFVKNGKGYEFSMLTADKKMLSLMTVEDSELSENIEGRVVDDQKKPIAALLIKLINDKGKIFTSVSTDKDGKFLFRNLPAGKNFMFEVDETDSRLATMAKIFITDAKNNIIREIIRDQKGKFTFRLLPSDQKVLVTSFVDDPLLKVISFMGKDKNNEKVKNRPEKNKAENNKPEKNKPENSNIRIDNNSVVVVENIYYPPDEVEILDEEGISVMKDILSLMSKDKSLQLEIGSYTDCRKSDNYNQVLSEKRAKFAMEYLTSRGINKRRVASKGYGESVLLNGCKDGVDCSEEDHAKNRRTEFRFSRSVR